VAAAASAATDDAGCANAAPTCSGFQSENKTRRSARRAQRRRGGLEQAGLIFNDAVRLSIFEPGSMGSGGYSKAIVSVGL